METDKGKSMGAKTEMKDSSTTALLLQGIPSESMDLAYRTGFQCPDPVFYLEHGRYRCLVVSELEFGRAQREARVTEVLTPALLGLKGDAARRIAHWALAAVRRRKLSRARVPGDFPFASARELESNAIRLTIAQGPVFPERQIKSAWEGKRMAKAQRVAAQAMRAAIRRIQAAAVDAKGRLRDETGLLTSEKVRFTIQQTALQLGATAAETIVACGREAADPHARGKGVLKAGEMIVLDIFPRMQASLYWGDMTRTVIKGRPSSRQLALYRAVQAAQQAALDSIRPGVRCATLHAMADKVLRERGFPTQRRKDRLVGFIHSTGHGLGLAIHEAPRISSGNLNRLRVGQVITIEPGWYDPEFGGVRIEDAVIVTRTGFDFLARCPYRFVL